MGGRHQLDDLARVEQALLRPPELVERARPRIVQLGRVGSERDGLRAERLSSKSVVQALSVQRRRTRVNSSTAVSYEVARYAAIPDAYSEAAVFIFRVYVVSTSSRRRFEQPAEHESEPSFETGRCLLQAL